MTLIQRLDYLIGLVNGFPRQWTSTYQEQPIRLAGVSERETSDRDSFVLVYPDDDLPFDHHRYIRVTLFDPELDHMYGDFEKQMQAYLRDRQTRPLGEEDDSHRRA